MVIIETDYYIVYKLHGIEIKILIIHCIILDDALAELGGDYNNVIKGKVLITVIAAINEIKLDE